MKTKALLAFLVAGAMTFTACNKKVDEKTMADINQFGTDWSALGEKASNWSKQLTETCQHAKDVTARHTEMMYNMINSKDEAMKSKMMDMTKMSSENSTTCDAMMNDWNTFKTSWDENTKMYTEWQAKVAKGEVSSEDAAKGLAEWKMKMTDAQQKIDNWNTAYNAVKESCDRNMASYDEMSKSMNSDSHHPATHVMPKAAHHKK